MALRSAWWRVTWEVGGASCPRHRAGKEAGAARLSGPAPRSASACTAFSCHPTFGRAVGHLRLVPLCLFSLRAYVGQTLHLGTHWPWCSALPARVSEAHPGGQDDGRSVPLSGNSPPRCLSTAQLPRAAPKPPGFSPARRSPTRVRGMFGSAGRPGASHLLRPVALWTYRFGGACEGR